MKTKLLRIKLDNITVFQLYVDDEQFEALKKQKPIDQIFNNRVQAVSISDQEIHLEIK